MAFRRTLSLAAAALALAAVGATARANIIVDGDFEGATAPTDFKFESGLSPVTIAAGMGVGGSNALDLPVNSADGYIKSTPGIMLVPGDTYLMSADVLSPADGVNGANELIGSVFRLGWFDGGANFIGIEFPPFFVTTPTYAHYSESFTVPLTETNPISIFMYGAAAFSGHYYVDNLTLEDTTVPLPEPASLSLLAGAGGLLLARRRR